MTLGDYAKKHGAKGLDLKLAQAADCSRGYITLLRLGKRTNPSRKIAVAIEKMTGGKVAVEAWEAA